MYGSKKLIEKEACDFGRLFCVVGLMKEENRKRLFVCLLISVYISSLPVAHLSDARPRRQLVVTGDSARIQDETTESFAWFFNVLGVYSTGPPFNVSSERQLVFLVGRPEFEPITFSDQKHFAHESYVIPTELYRLVQPETSRYRVFLNNPYPTFRDHEFILRRV